MTRASLSADRHHDAHTYRRLRSTRNKIPMVLLGIGDILQFPAVNGNMTMAIRPPPVATSLT